MGNNISTHLNVVDIQNNKISSVTVYNSSNVENLKCVLLLISILSFLPEYIHFSWKFLILWKAGRKPTLQWFSSLRHNTMHGPANWSPTSASSLWCPMCKSFCWNYRLQSSFIRQCTWYPSWTREESIRSIEQLYPKPAGFGTVLWWRIPKCGYQSMPSKPKEVQLLTGVELF